ncbi:MAG: hypothetical protein ACFFC3_16775 [Candidatus Odinarchaeota archaeon]
MEYRSKTAIRRWLNTQIELIQQLKDQSVHINFFKKGTEGPHHISGILEELKPYIKNLKNRSFQILQSGQIGKQKYVFLIPKNHLD